MAVASDPEGAALWPNDVDPRYVVQQAAAKALVGKLRARAGVSAQMAADLLYGLLSPEHHLLFVQARGWPRERWERWVLRTLHAQLWTDRGPPDRAGRGVRVPPGRVQPGRVQCSRSRSTAAAMAAKPAALGWMWSPRS
ncbi:hypothetical protein [Nonomuraea sp. NPDC049758]|uniref:hypothetical protein n=1 Tax=Nonomuraea sp. NPDC049758 TaxID=3154360 RepID=UPI00341E2211